MKQNIGKLFYQDYYKRVNFDYVIGRGGKPDDDSQKSIQKMNKAIKEAELEEIKKLEICSNCLLAEIAYPGLVTGIGLEHSSKKLKGAFNLGMHFDYTTGMPVVYGSSVKGMLKSYFEVFCAKEGIPEEEGKVLKKEIFDGVRKDGTHISIYKRDVFFDAVIVEPNKKKHFLEEDAITPHTEGPLKEPIPITMLKIASGCKIEFRFRLQESECKVNGKTYSSGKKLNLFKDILETVGIGAKTNVGYGQFLSVLVK